LCSPPSVEELSSRYGWDPELVQFYNYVNGDILRDDHCHLCGEQNINAFHVLVKCQSALDQKRFTYRHDEVLEVIKRALRTALMNQQQGGILSHAEDWEIFADKGNRHYRFPQGFSNISDEGGKLYPDILAVSRQTKQVNKSSYDSGVGTR
jgi:hypothetical protein